MVINGIDTNDISVVVQGAVDKYITPLCLASIREHLPGAEIILSTWEGTNVEGLDYDQVLLNKDPGGYDYWNQEYTIKGNTNRQIYSTIQGLRTAKGKYAAKVRTDFVFESAGFISWFNKYPARNDEYSFFESKVICCDNFSRDPRYQHRLRFLRLVLHPSDFFFFGYKDDLIKICKRRSHDLVFSRQDFRDDILPRALRYLDIVAAAGRNVFCTKASLSGADKYLTFGGNPKAATEGADYNSPAYHAEKVSTLLNAEAL